MKNNHLYVFNIITESCGRVLGINNIELNPFDIEIKKGMQIDDILPILLGIFPLSSEEITLEKVSHNDFFGNIFIQTNHHDVRIYFFSEPEKIKEWQEIHQKYNQDKLISKLALRTKNNAIPSDIVDSLGFMGFEKTEAGYQIIANVPLWFRQIFPNYNYSSSIFQLEVLFPFLEVFFPEVNVLFNSSDLKRLYSGLWTVPISDNEDVILQASAVNTTTKKYIFIESISDRNPDKHFNLQKSRELSLKHSQLIKTEEALRELLKYREQFISIFSHDIKNPLAGSYSLMELLKSDKDFMASFNEENKNLFDIIIRNIKGILDYSEQLYEWSSLKFATIKLNIVDIDLLDLMNDIVVNFKERLETKQIEVVFEIEENLSLKADMTFIKNAFQNIINNAIKFSHFNSKIIISAKMKDNNTTIIIQDFGIGITDDIKDTIFDYDTKVSTYGTDGEKGTGIGLTIAKRIMDLHNANIGIDTVLKKGTSFILEFPK